MSKNKINKINKLIYDKVSAEVDNILNEPESSCSFFFNQNNEYVLTGADDIIKVIDYTYLIPNLFRKCYIYKSISIPNICLNCINNTTNVITKYLPYILEENLIKSFLYFNFPVNIKYYNNINSYISRVINYRIVIDNKAKNTTYGSITPSPTLYNYIYSNNSMLTNLIAFNSILNNQTSGCPYIVPWDYTTGCFITRNRFTNEVEEYIVGPFDDNNIISQTTIDILNYLRYTYFNNFTFTNINYNDILLLFKSNIYVILQYAQEVYLDILNVYASILIGTDYCMKDYMSISNVPILMELYNNFYNNQIYSNNNSLPISSIVDLVPQPRTLTNLVLSFIIYFNNIPNLGLVFNAVTLNNEEAIIFCCNTRVFDYTNINRSDYSYYYLNVNSTGATQLYNYWGITGNVPIYTGSTGQLPDDNNLYNNQFPIDFLYGVTGGSYNIKSYLSNVNCTKVEYQSNYNDGGVYDVIYGYNRSISFTGSFGAPSYFCNGQTYNVYNDLEMTSLNSKVYLTFETNGTTGTNVSVGVGLPLVYYPLSSNLIIYPP
jgi:hypothetical protein